MNSELSRRNADWQNGSLVDGRRRHIIKVLAGAGLVLGSGVAGKLAFACAGVQPGIQLYTVRSLMQQDVQNTLQLLARLGYTQLEFAGLFGKPAGQIATWLGELGLSAPAGHVMLQPLLHETNRVLDDALALGHRYLVMPYLTDAERGNGLAGYQQLAAKLNRVGEQCQAAGITLAYHNHDFEFSVIDNVRPYDMLLSQTDASLVKMEIDFYWAAKMQVDVTALFHHYPGRFPLWHLKDMTADGNFANLGKGVIDFTRAQAAASVAGLQYAFVERDVTDDLTATLKQGVHGFNQIFC
ncbi:sugar phosphate isomerase/epimerase family protein [Arsukibacterium sp.]|uniref:sugar phosphate isomerase/epimerase family protein n=1 Tax=Arsukibacterium sp. TaxID=1977258 RepID=UPI00299D7D07|nr:TIM barrel protein [Arsukibacterium sp.]MDX1677495.1 TIM barrel protein [Arsukibacterium sp.]